jgi:hypothetical protein
MGAWVSPRSVCSLDTVCTVHVTDYRTVCTYATFFGKAKNETDTKITTHSHTASTDQRTVAVGVIAMSLM